MDKIRRFWEHDINPISGQQIRIGNKFNKKGYSVERFKKSSVEKYLEKVKGGR